ncbi:MAG: SDR family oxidoreductase [Methylophilaceae bacterium]|jgi:short-subunit dehydrogenase
MKKILITGASSGIGLALAHKCAIHFARENVVLGLVGRKLNILKQIAQELESKYNATCVIYALDVRDGAALNEAAIDFITRFGAPNIVIASAGVSRGTLTEHQEDIVAFQAIMDINVMGMVKTFSPFITAMQEAPPAEQTQLVGIASVAGIRGLPGAGAYSASKAAAITYLESLRVEMRPYGIGVTTVAPGYIRTPMTDINEYKMPFLMGADVFAQKCIAAIEKNRRFIIIPWQMGWMARLMRFIPPALWDGIMRKAPYKERTDWDWL